MIRIRIKKMGSAAVFCLLMLVSSGSAKDRITTTQADSLIARGRQLLNYGRSSQALVLFKKVLETFPENVEARFGRAETHLDLRQWGEASDWFNKVLDVQPDRVAAHYGEAVAKREIGKHAVLIQRYLIWRSSRKHFEEAAALDSTFRDLLFQWALLERYDRNFEKAILLKKRGYVETRHKVFEYPYPDHH